jgi:VCBS repeat protein/centrosomal CEP192-like protein/HYDIN/CFA65/VesB family protein
MKRTKRSMANVLYTVALMSVYFLWLVPLSLAQSYVFNRADYLTTAAAQSVALADFNGDGILDMAVVNQGEYSSISILLGKPDGTFEESVSECPIQIPQCKITQFLISGAPVSLAVGDFNGDGKLDLAVANWGANSVSIMLGNGDGTFQSGATYAAGNLPYSIISADFNGDGKADLAVSNDMDGTISIFLGNGDGTFQAQKTFAAGSFPYTVVAGDFNGDGKVDLATANWNSSTVSVLLGNGDGTFQAVQQYPAGFRQFGLAVGDFNGDHKLDLVTTSTNMDDESIGEVNLLLGNGDGTFQAPAVYAAGAMPDSVVAADVNGDGKLDLVVADSTSNAVWILLGKGNGTFATAVNYSVGTQPLWVAVGDINRDGRLDVAVANAGCIDASCTTNTSSVSVLIGNGDGTFGRTASTALQYLTHAITEGDFTGNGKPDLAAAVAESQVDVLLNNQGKFPTSVAYPAGDDPVAIVAADFNRDGNLDLATFDGGGDAVSILLGNGNGTFQANVDYQTGLQNNVGVASMAVGDFNGDGYPDLVVVNGNTIELLLNAGNGSFPNVTAPYGVTFPTSLNGVAVGDFNGDGKTDLAITASNSTTNTSWVIILLGNGNGTFTQAAVNTFATPNQAGFVAAKDLNGDGKLDLVVACQPPFSNVLPPALVTVLLGNGDGTFQAHVDYPLGTNNAPEQIVIADWNSDGIPDIGVANEGGRTFSILLGTGSGTFYPHVDYLTPGLPYSLAAADFNGDGGMDLAVTNEISGATNPNVVSVFSNSPVIALYPNVLSFGNQFIGTTATSTITVSNSGSAKLTITSIVVSGSDFRETNNCGTSLAPGANCTISVTFKPTAEETYTGHITLTDSAATGHQTILLSGAGAKPVVKISANTLSFGNQTVGTTSATKSVTFTNTGNETLTITNIAITGADAGDFSQTTTCGTSVPAGSSCMIAAIFTPEAKGTRSAAISVADNASGSPQKVTLTGTGK